MRGAGYNMPGVILDGTDVLGCYRLAKEAIDRARGGDGPTLLEAKVTRLTAHSSDDQQTKYRSEEELAAEKERDALPRFREQLRDAGILDEEVELRLSAEIASLVEDATDFAESEPDADPATALEHVYGDDAAGEPPPPWHPAPGQPAPGHQAPGAPSEESWS